ncbi:PIN domain nuclease [Clostridium sediminicola]|uniref:PIN/TRAM domain-containing protein n=1 Tax=Clostridium sediminicola TaxID=3114879 RepID=UPI0031F2763F
MFDKVLRGLFTLAGIVIGFFCANILLRFDGVKSIVNSQILVVIIYVFVSLLFGLILFLISPFINKIISKAMNYFEKNIQKRSGEDILIATFGALLGLIISAPFVNLLSGVNILGNNILGTIIGVILAIIMASLGAEIAIKKKDDIIGLFANLKKTGDTKEKKVKQKCKGIPKVLDTSVVIDGRILDISKTGFIEGTMVIPNFVLDELRHIADSSDNLKRKRGRRGLDILNKIQKESGVDILITDKDFPEISEVDSKLIKLAQTLKGIVLTNDFNLNKVAGVQGVPVLNINELANAVKPVVLPGEEMTIQIIKDGKEQEQGIAYLDDGTMIVVEGAKRQIGEIMDVIVTSVLQTAAGRMIFAKQKR